MKLKFLMGAMLALAMVSVDAHAQQNSARPSVRSLKSIDLPAAKGPLAQPQTQAQAQAQSSVTTQSSPGPILGAAAPPLSQVFIYAVGSTNCGWEYMTTVGQASTTCDHGGDELRTAVVEIGYGANPTAFINGLQLPVYENYTVLPVCLIGGYYSWFCPASYTVVGFLRLYAADGFQDGLFGFQDTSANFPYNTMYTQINIL